MQNAGRWKLEAVESHGANLAAPQAMQMMRPAQASSDVKPSSRGAGAQGFKASRLPGFQSAFGSATGQLTAAAIPAPAARWQLAVASC
ncbi:uncharacterized protein UV8b_00224 [Ustilaginoidea virens]|uniref:Uncharacterized protein n=1 Tax=Ustilaginoidea virens TaxID=1159556 RepID=A0A063C313_USTVR|nr:uncharacterized protein UV8b_00224 [Ustilaginoidea virens]QUC15983.1 hypothetical protein UV8b_00224 [Ustilaginoidea virens]GAO17346.1 hypothetical protein UVI_02038660 [Ustilaginoidea virens]